MARLFADIRPEERKAAASAFLALFGILAAHTILETARDALFLARLPATRLPWMYLAIALTAVLLTDSPFRKLGRRVARFSLAILLVLSGAVTFVFWLASGWTGASKLYALYVWTGVFGTLMSVEFWLIMSEAYTVTQAKRVFRVVGMGSVLGAVAGSGVARIVAGSFPAENLLLTASAAMAIAGVGPALLLRREGKNEEKRGAWSLRKSLATIGDNVYLKNLTILVLVSTIALTVADFVFKSAVARSVPKESLGSFFATFYMGLNLLALLTQLFFAGALMRLLGLHRALWVLPTLVALGSAGVAFGGGLIAALFLKGSDGAMRYSLHKTGMELLFVPIPDSLRSRVKPFIDVMGQRGGQAIASLVILAESQLHRGEYVLASAAGALSLVWIGWSADIKKHYLNLFRDALKEGSILSSVDLPELDLGSLESLFTALNSGTDAEVLAALDLLAEEGRSRLVPGLILYHPSPAVVLRAMEIFETSGRDDFIPIADRLLAHPNAEIRAAALRAKNVARPDEASLRAATADVDSLVRATALVGLAFDGWASAEDKEVLEGISCSGSLATRIALARAIARRPAPVFVSSLALMGDSAEDEVRLEVARAMGAVRSDAFLPALISFLASHEVRGSAREALLAHGQVALDFLREALADEALPHEIRRHVPRALVGFEPVAVGRALESRLLEEPDGLVRFRIIRAMGRLAHEHPELKFDSDVLMEAIQKTIQATYQLIDWRVTLERGALAVPQRATPGHEILVALLKDKETHAIERLFRLLSLRLKKENFKPIHRGLRSANPKIRASSRELVENVLRPPLRDAVAGLIDDGSDEERLATWPGGIPGRLSYDSLLGHLLDQPGETLKSIAASHIGELGLVQFKAKLASMDRTGTGLFVRRVFERALQVLDRAQQGSAAHA